jgi:hypothetical protein
MGFLINSRKVRAAAGSMHQFLQPVRTIFPGPVSDKIVEAATIYLYMNLARDLFGLRFANQLQRKLRRELKYGTAREVEARIAAIVRMAAALEKAAAGTGGGGRAPEDVVRAHVVSVIEAMLNDAGLRGEDPETARKAYEPFERTVKDMRRHLLGIKEQNSFLMRSQ